MKLRVFYFDQMNETLECVDVESVDFFFNNVPGFLINNSFDGSPLSEFFSFDQYHLLRIVDSPLGDK